MRSKTRFLDPKFSRDSCETRKSKLVVRLASCESRRQKFHSENREKWVSLWNFEAKIASYESRRKKSWSKTRFSQILQTNFVARIAVLQTNFIARLANINFVARLARIISNINSGVLRESCENFGSNNNFSLWIMILLVCESRKLHNILHFSLLMRVVRLARLALIFSREVSLIFHKILREKLQNETPCQPYSQYLFTMTKDDFSGHPHKN